MVGRGAKNSIGRELFSIRHIALMFVDEIGNQYAIAGKRTDMLSLPTVIGHVSRKGNDERGAYSVRVVARFRRTSSKDKLTSFFRHRKKWTKLIVESNRTSRR